MKFKKLVCFCMLLLICMTGCSDGQQKQPDTAIEQQAEIFFGILKDTLPEQRNTDDLLDMLCYQAHEADAKRKDALQEMVIQDYEITNIVKLTDDVYAIFATFQEMDIIQKTIFYAIKEDDNWKLVFGKDNIPDVYQQALEEQKIEIPTIKLPEGTEAYPIQ